ncbi:MAG: PD40 domain-containing protein, partial [Actinobacteria bacterium]|nr:PD40 domain-containing protein [Actinomycetota bacterium]
SPDGRLLATGGADGFARLWEVASGGQAGSFRASRAGAVTGVAFSPDGRLLATAGADGIARLWEVAAHRMIGASIPVSLGFTSVAFSPSGKVLATAGNNMVRLWPAGRGVLQQIGTPLAAGNERMNAVAFSPDGRTIATASGDGTARLWDTATHQQVGPSLIASNGGVSSVAFRPGGNVLATASDDGTAQLWDVALPKDTDLVRAACSISGRSLLPDEWSAFIKSVPFRQVCPG